MQLQFITTREELQALIDCAFDETYKKVLDSTPTKNPIEIINGATLRERLDITEPTEKRWRDNGKLPSMRIGSAIRYDWYKVLAALEVKKTQRA